VFAVMAFILVMAPSGLVVVSFLALTTSVSGALPSQGAASLVPMLCPVPGAVITQDFGPTSFALEPPGFGYPHFHAGVDLAAPTGTPVLAASNGIVETAGIMIDALGLPIGYGNYIKVVVAGREEQIYGHLSNEAVTPNTIVRAGDPIGKVGNTGTSTGAHLHFEVRIAGVPVDPSRFIKC
jgi:murein DD-endopeptidase MepM/ murein hydrolase activator NlpD